MGRGGFDDGMPGGGGFSSPAAGPARSTLGSLRRVVGRGGGRGGGLRGAPGYEER